MAVRASRSSVSPATTTVTVTVTVTAGFYVGFRNALALVAPFWIAVALLAWRLA